MCAVVQQVRNSQVGILMDTGPEAMIAAQRVDTDGEDGQWDKQSSSDTLTQLTAKKTAAGPRRKRESTSLSSPQAIAKQSLPTSPATFSPDPCRDPIRSSSHRTRTIGQGWTREPDEDETQEKDCIPERMQSGLSFVDSIQDSDNQDVGDTRKGTGLSACSEFFQSNALLEQVLLDLRQQSHMDGIHAAIADSEPSERPDGTDAPNPSPLALHCGALVSSPCSIGDKSQTCGKTDENKSAVQQEGQGDEEVDDIEKKADDEQETESIDHGSRSTSDWSDMPSHEIHIEWAHVRRLYNGAEVARRLHCSTSRRSSSSESNFRQVNAVSSSASADRRSDECFAQRIAEVDSDGARRFLSAAETDADEDQPRSATSSSYTSSSERSGDSDDDASVTPPVIANEADEEHGIIDHSSTSEGDEKKSRIDMDRMDKEEGLPPHLVVPPHIFPHRPLPRRTAAKGAGELSSSVVDNVAEATGMSGCPPLLRALRRSACSTFWSPSARTSLQTQAQSLPRVIVPSKREGSGQDQDEKGYEERVLLVKTDNDRQTCVYTRPNFRATIYPRRPDEFDRDLHQAIEERLWLMLQGGRTRARSLSSRSPRPPPLLETAPRHALPDVPNEDSLAGLGTEQFRDQGKSMVRPAGKRLSCESSWTTYSSASGLTDEGLMPGTDNRQRSMSVNASATTVKRTSWQRDPMRDSWTTVTESVTSYCSWISYTSGSSISSSSSCPALRSASYWSTQGGAVANPVKTDQLQTHASLSPLLQASIRAASRAEKPGFLCLPERQSASPGPPSSCLMPANLLVPPEQPIGEAQVCPIPALPCPPILSPFFIDVYEYWPWDDDQADAEPALEKWARRQGERQATNESTLVDQAVADGWQTDSCDEGGQIRGCSSNGSTSTDTITLSDVQFASSSASDDDSCSASSSSSSSVLTPPRSEFLYSDLESPGKHLSQIVSPSDCEAMFADASSDESAGEAKVTVGSLGRMPPRGSPAQYRPAHKRWILVDSAGNRITSGSQRDSMSTRIGEKYGAGTRRLLHEADQIASTSSSSDSSDSDDCQSTGRSYHVQARNNALPSKDDCSTELTTGMLVTSPQEMTDISGSGRGSDGGKVCFNLHGSTATLATPVVLPAVSVGREKLRSILKTSSTVCPIGQTSESSGHISSSSMTHSSSSALSVHFHEQPSQRPAKTSIYTRTAAVPHDRSDQSSGSISSLLLDGTGADSSQSSSSASQRMTIATSTPVNDLRKAVRQDLHLSTCTTNSSSSCPSSTRLTRADLASRLQREEVRKKRNEERLDALDKLEGKNKKSYLLANLIKSSSLEAMPGSGAFGSLATAAAVNKAMKIKPFGHRVSAAAAVEPVVDTSHEAMRAASGPMSILAYNNGSHDIEVATTPLTPTRETLREWEREWEAEHHVAQFTPGHAQRFTNVTGFDIGIVPFNQERQQRIVSEMAAAAVKAKKGATVQRPNAESKGKRDRRPRDPHGFPIDSKLATPIQPTRPPRYDVRLERDLHAGLRKLSVAVDARQTAKERCVDK